MGVTNNVAHTSRLRALCAVQYFGSCTSSILQWRPQPSTVIGLGVLGGTLAYLVTGDPVWARLAAAAVKILVPDNSGSEPARVIDAIGAIAKAFGRPLPEK